MDLSSFLLGFALAIGCSWVNDQIKLTRTLSALKQAAAIQAIGMQAFTKAAEEFNKNKEKKNDQA